MSTERALGLSARLLAGASALTVVGLAVGLWSAWRQTGQFSGVDGTVSDSGLPFSAHLGLFVFDLHYRQLGAQLMLTCALLAAAVLALHQIPSWNQVRRLRWEVLGAGIVALGAVMGLVLAHLAVLTSSDDAAGDMTDFMGPQPLTELSLSNLLTLAASLLILGVTTLWWLRLGASADGDDVDGADVDGAEDDGDTGVGDDPVHTATAVDVVPETHAQSLTAGSRTMRDASDTLGHGAAMGYPQDWSPEDFQPPR